LAFGSGVGLGLFLGEGAPATTDESEKTKSVSSSDFSPTPEGQERIEANTLLSNRIRELEKELADQKKGDLTSVADRIALLKKYNLGSRLQAVMGPTVTPEMAVILGLSKEEKQAVEEHLGEIAEEMEKLKDADTVLSKQTANSVAYDIPVDPQGDVLKEKLRGLLSSDIGADRADFLMSGGGYDSYGPFAGFAEQKGGIEITWIQQNGAPFYTVKETNGNGAMSFSQATLGEPYSKYLPMNSGQ
jgi:hypothetical protein